MKNEESNEKDLEKKETTEKVEKTEKKEEKKTQESKEEKKIEELKTQIKEEKAKSDEYYEHLKRNMAEFDNFKKRMSKEKDMMYNSISADIVSELLPILDNFEKALASDTKDETFKDGMQMIYNQIKTTLEKIGVVEIDALNKEFDPNIHEAVMHVEDENYGEKEVVEVLRKGYKIGDKIIRHAMVKVAN